MNNTNRPTASQRRELFHQALSERDPYTAREIEAHLTQVHIPERVRQLDSVAMELRNERYQSLSPLRATDLFAERYESLYWDDEFESASQPSSGLEYGLIYASPSNIHHMWRARQCADTLGMEYEDYIESVFHGRISLKLASPPLPQEMHDQVAFVMGARGKQRVQAMPTAESKYGTPELDELLKSL